MSERTKEGPKVLLRGDPAKKEARTPARKGEEEQKTDLISLLRRTRAGSPRRSGG